jgi:hypothetical protein
MSCLGWNNMADFIFQILILLVFKLIMTPIAKLVMDRETKRLANLDLQARIKVFEKID